MSVNKYPYRVLYGKGCVIMARNCCCSNDRKTVLTDQDRRKLINRLNRLEGQIRGIKGMVERDCYCPDILNQCSAAIAALNSFSRDLVGAHIRGCVARDLKDGDESSIDELVYTLQKLMKG